MRRIYYYLILCALVGSGFSTYGQTDNPQLAKEIETHIRFLASDELMGRETGEAGNNIASAYISAFFAGNGLKQVEGANGFYQDIPFVMFNPPKSASMTWEETTWTHGKDLLFRQGEAGEISGEAVFVEYGMIDEEKGIDDYKGLDLKGKIVVANLGMPEMDNPAEIVSLSEKKKAWVIERGGIAFIELYRLSAAPWKFAVRRMNRKQLQIASNDFNSPEAKLPYAWAEDKGANFAKALKKKGSIPVTLKNSGVNTQNKASRNVLGYVEGTDPTLKKEYILVTAHFDHVGTGKGGGRITDTDSIFNGARDNAIGTVGVMMAAKLLAANPPKRSVLFLTVTGEEKGMLGSRYYASHPLLPLKDMVFNLNSDGAGYNDKSMITVIGFNHVDIEGMIKVAAEKHNLAAGGDAMPRQNLYDRSDNVSFASKGIPAINLSPGVTGFDEELMTYYHQVADEAESLDFDYVSRVCLSFAEVARLLADADKTPGWRAESKYAEGGKKLYEDK